MVQHGRGARNSSMTIRKAESVPQHSPARFNGGMGVHRTRRIKERSRQIERYGANLCRMEDWRLNCLTEEAII